MDSSSSTCNGPMLGRDGPTRWNRVESSSQILNGSSALELQSCQDHARSRTPNGAATPDLETKEPIAVIGMAMKFPGDATDAVKFWDMIVHGRSARSRIPPERFNHHAFYSAGQTKDGMMNVDSGHFIVDNPAAFDAPFFSITPEEAKSMDPVQRWLLEVTYHAFENAGISLDKVAGTNTSVFIGASNSDYSPIQARDTQIDQVYGASGSASALISNRISWFYDLKAASLSIDTACSSSLTAFHYACQSIWNGESTMSISGGVNLIFDPATFLALAGLQLLSEDGICYSFDHRANGYGRGEGLGVVLLKPLSKALREGDTIRAIVRATGVNQNGHGSQFQPDAEAQERLIRQTYESANLSLGQTRYVEAHGTGTIVGDPIEARAIGSALGPRKPGDEVYVGAVKTNLGHLEGASGMAGIIKAILVLENAVIPPNAWYEKTNPAIKEKELGIKFLQSAVPWPDRGLRRASVNSFGFGGANAHIILDDAYNYLKARNMLEKSHHATRIEPPLQNQIHDLVQLAPMTNGLTEHPEKPRLFVFSAASRKALDEMIKAFAEHLDTVPRGHNEQHYLQDLAWTLSEKRSQLPWRTFATAKSLDELVLTLCDHKQSATRSSHRPSLCCVFTGQGSQWATMGRELVEFPVFKESLDAAELYFKSLGSSWCLQEELNRDESTTRLGASYICQPICTALQIALIDLLHSLNIDPSISVGHSSGEIAAAYCCGALDRESALRVAYYRGVVTQFITQSSKDQGAMLFVALPDAKVQTYIDDVLEHNRTGQLSIGCYNSPNGQTVTGSIRNVTTLEDRLTAMGISSTRLKVDIAYHSQQMESVKAVYSQLIHNLRPSSLQHQSSRVISSVTGLEIDIGVMTSPEYWVQNLIQPVLFHQAIGQISLGKSYASLKAGDSNSTSIHADYVLEIGPHGALKSFIRDTLIPLPSNEFNDRYSSALFRGSSAMDTFLKAIGRMHQFGFDVAFSKLRLLADSANKSLLTSIPPYPFNRDKSYWLESALTHGLRFRKTPHHELVGTRVADWNEEFPRWRMIMTQEKMPWIKDHKVNGVAICPAAGYLTMAFEGYRQTLNQNLEPNTYHVKDFTIYNALVVPPTGHGIEVQLLIRQPPPRDNKSSSHSGWAEFDIISCSIGQYQWQRHCGGKIRAEFSASTEDESGNKSPDSSRKPLSFKLFDQQSEYENNCSTAELYSFLRKYPKMDFGPSMRYLENIRYNNTGGAMATVDLDAWKEKLPSTVQPHIIHPAALDAVFQSIFPALTRGCHERIASVVPTKIRSLSLSSDFLYPTSTSKDLPAKPVTVISRCQRSSFRHTEVSITGLEGKDGLPILNVDMQCTFLPNDSSVSESSNGVEQKTIGHHLVWKPDIDLLSNEELTGHCLSDLGTRRLAEELILEDKSTIAYISLMKLKAKGLLTSTSVKHPHHLKYMSWASHMLAIAEERDPYYAKASVEEIWKDENKYSQLEEMVENHDVEGKLFTKISRNVEAILSGKVEALEVLFSGNTMHEYYEAQRDVFAAFRCADNYMDLLAHKNPDMKILEIGAGTGGTTKGIVDKLTESNSMQLRTPRFSEYVFTDISPDFFEKAQERFRNYDHWMKYMKLNIAEDPLEQGFKEDSYDVVIASNVLHATTDLCSTLKSTRKLLRPGGKLVLLEAMRNDHLVQGFIFGLLPGWWAAKEKTRGWSPLATREEWHEALIKSGFSGVDISFPPDEDVVTLVSTAIEEPDEELPAGIQSIQCNNVDRIRAADALPSNIVIFTAHDAHNSICEELKSIIEATSNSVCSIVVSSCEAETSYPESFASIILDTGRPLLANLSGKSLARLQSLIKAADSLLWISSQNDIDIDSSLCHGLVRSLKSELMEKVVTLACLQLEKDQRKIVAEIYRLLLKQGRSGISSDLETEYRAYNGAICVPRVSHNEELYRHVSQQTLAQGIKHKEIGAIKLPLKLDVGTPGLLDTLHFVCVNDDLPLNPSEVKIAVKAVGLNFRDVLLALGHAYGTKLGQECAGVITQCSEDTGFRVGDRVACCFDGTFTTEVRCHKSSIIRIPENVSWEVAASFPVIYITAYTALIEKARIRKGETVLIHSAAGGFGQACVQIAQLHGCEIFATVGTEEKTKFLVERYRIQPDHIFSSRNMKFATDIQQLTAKKGVDVIINSLSGEGLRASWECISANGRFVDVSKADAVDGNEISMAPFSRGATFMSVDLVHLRETRPDEFSKLMAQSLSLITEQKATMPDPLQAYSVSKFDEAFNYLGGGKSHGKFVITLNDEDVIPVASSTIPSWSFDPNATYLIAGGLGGIGRSLALWLVRRGARNLILLSRTVEHGSEVKALLRDLKQMGANVLTPPCDIANKESLPAALALCSSLPPIRGCIQAAMQLEDKAFANMSLTQFQTPLGPKAHGTHHLDRSLPDGMDFFITLSSLSGIIGLPGQSNYNSGNTYQDALARARILRGEKAVSLNLCDVETVGYIARNADEHFRTHSIITSGSFARLTEAELHALMDYYCNPDLPLLPVEQAHVVLGLTPPASLVDEGDQAARTRKILQRPVFRGLANANVVGGSGGGGSSQDRIDAAGDAWGGFKKRLSDAKSPDAAIAVVVKGIDEKLSQKLGLEVGAVDELHTLVSYGIDSLSAIELKTWLKSCLGADVATFEIIGDRTVSGLARLVVERSSYTAGLRDGMNKEES